MNITTKLIIPDQFPTDEIPGTRMTRYSIHSDLTEMLQNEKEDFIFICYESEFSKYKDIAKKASYLIIISFTREFMQFSYNIFFINGEKSDGYTIQLIVEMLRVNNHLKEEILENYKIGIDLSAEKDKKALWEKILRFSRKSTSAEAGALYLLSEDKKNIYFLVSQNDKLDIREFVGKKIPFNKKSLVGFVCSTGETLNIEDAYTISTALPYSHNHKLDYELDYKTQSIITVPMVTDRGEIIGALQIINKKVRETVVSFTNYDEILLTSLASLSAVTIENNRLYLEIEELFESFVMASTKAIDQRDPATKDHSERVSHYTKMLMDAVSKDSKIFPEIKFAANDAKVAEIAAVLHDIGKLGVKEHLLTKINKLSEADYERVKGRFWFVKLSLEKSELIERCGKYKDDIGFIEELIENIDRINTPGALQMHDIALVKQAQSKVFYIENQEVFLLTKREADYLLIEKGNLNSAERKDVESHAQKSYEILKTMKWPKELSSVPEHVLNHHEKLDGSGYPSKKRAKDLHIIDRIIAIADIYDALTAGDRTYKKPLHPMEALSIMESDAMKSKIDQNLFVIFKQLILKYA